MMEGGLFFEKRGEKSVLDVCWGMDLVGLQEFEDGRMKGKMVESWKTQRFLLSGEQANPKRAFCQFAYYHE